MNKERYMNERFDDKENFDIQFQLLDYFYYIFIIYK